MKFILAGRVFADSAKWWGKSLLLYMKPILHRPLFPHSRLQIIRRTSENNLIEENLPVAEIETSKIPQTESTVDAKEEKAQTPVIVEKRKKKLTSSLSQWVIVCAACM